MQDLGSGGTGCQVVMAVRPKAQCEDRALMTPSGHAIEPVFPVYPVLTEKYIGMVLVVALGRVRDMAPKFLAVPLPSNRFSTAIIQLSLRSLVPLGSSRR